MAIAKPEPPLSEILDSLEKKIALVSSDYEQFFVGIIKKEPSKKRAEVEAIIRRLSRERIHNTAHRFRFQQLRARLTTMSYRWTRAIKQIEDGTFPRDQFRLKLRNHPPQLDNNDIPPEKQLPSGERKSQEPQIKDTVVDQSHLKRVFNDFVETRKRCAERTDNVRFDKMVAFMKHQTEAIKNQYGCKAVRFEVISDGGRAKLKAIPVRGK